MDIRKKQELFKEIERSGFFAWLEQQDLFLAFINSFKDLKSMRSTDGRPQFKNAEDDIRQHYIMNEDWTLDEVFSSKVGIYENDVIFNSFLLSVVDSRYSENDDVQGRLHAIISPYLHEDGQELYLFGYNNDGKAVFKIRNVDEEYSPRDLAANWIPIYVDKHPTGNSKYAANHQQPDKFPAIVLAFNRGWDDFSVCTWFDMFYYDGGGNCSHVGVVKIIHTTYKTQEQLNAGYYYTSEHIDDAFTQLSSEYCSLGQTEDYYFKLRRLLGGDFMSVMWAMRDCALFPMIEEKFSNHPNFYSLIRENEAEDVLNDIMYKLRDEDAETKFKFSYRFKPIFAEEPTEIPFAFSSEGRFPNRLYSIIGRNGAGKTQFISQLPLDLEAKNMEKFNHVPNFKKCITVSYCYYDHFQIPDSSATFNYRYCGLLKKHANGSKEVMTPEELQARLIENCSEISRKGRIREWKQVMMTFFNEETLDSWLEGEHKERLNKKAIADAARIMSSGQSSFVYVFFDILAHIRNYSLILFDEPETHLHPEAITSLINAIYNLLGAYKSYGIIVTHSPQIVREMMSRNVLVMKRIGNSVTAHKIGIETFGENLSVLSNEIFGSEETQPYFKQIIAEYMGRGMSYERMVGEIQTADLPLSLNLKMYIKNLELRNHEEG